MDNDEPSDKCGSTLAVKFEHGPTRPRAQNCCSRESLPDSDKCVWHTDPGETDYKTIDALKAARDSVEIRKLQRAKHPFWRVEVRELLDRAQLANMDLGNSLSFNNTALRVADLSGTDLKQADLSKAILSKADLSGADLRRADLSGADLRRADLSEANLRRADLSGADLRRADLSGADLRRADLSRAVLTKADLSGTNLERTNLFRIDVDSLQIEDIGDVTVDSQTKITSRIPLRSGFHPGGRRHLTLVPYLGKGWGDRAQGYEQLRKVFQEKGLDEHHRTLYAYQRRARAKESFHTRHFLQWITNHFSRILTGYGVRVTRVFFWTAVVILVPWYWYGLVEGWANESLEGGPLYYSIVTFVTSPPHPIPNVQGNIDLLGTTVDRQNLNQSIVLFQTYAGTALIILLGYVLGNRDRI